MRHYLDAARGRRATRSEDEDEPAVILNEDPPGDRQTALARWQAAREHFLTTLAASQEHRDQLQHVYEITHRDEVRDREMDALKETKRQTDAQHEQAEAALSARRARHRSSRPGFFSRLLRTRSYRRWRDEGNEIALDTRALEADQRHTDRHFRESTDAIERTHSESGEQFSRAAPAVLRAEPGSDPEAGSAAETPAQLYEQVHDALGEG